MAEFSEEEMRWIIEDLEVEVKQLRKENTYLKILLGLLLAMDVFTDTSYE